MEMFLRTDGEEPIKVWHFHRAPKKFQVLSGHGGDEDWVALIPASWDGEIPYWADEGGRFGCCSVSEHKQLDGSLILIGAHA